jgi:hypothetical protein
MTWELCKGVEFVLPLNDTTIGFNLKSYFIREALLSVLATMMQAQAFLMKRGANAVYGS